MDRRGERREEKEEEGEEEEEKRSVKIREPLSEVREKNTIGEHLCLESVDLGNGFNGQIQVLGRLEYV